MTSLNLANILFALLATAGGLFVIVWLFAAPVEKSKARGMGMMIGSMLHYLGGRDRNDPQ